MSERVFSFYSIFALINVLTSQTRIENTKSGGGRRKENNEIPVSKNKLKNVRGWKIFQRHGKYKRFVFILELYSRCPILG